MMTSQSDDFQRICSIDRDLLFFNADEQQLHLGLLTPKEHKKLQSMIRTVHHDIQKITNLQRTSSVHSATTSTLSSTNGSPPRSTPPTLLQQQQLEQRQRQHSDIHDFFRKKQIKHLYTKLKSIKERYSTAMQEQQIRQLDSDMERYQQLQVIHGLSGRLDVSSQLYDELQHLRHSLTTLRREWKLDRIQSIVSSLALPSSLAPISSTLLAPPPSSPNTTTTTITGNFTLLEQHGHRWYPSLDRNKWSSSVSSSSSTSSFTNQPNKHRFISVLKNYFRQHPWSSRIGKTSETTIKSDNNNNTTTTPPSSSSSSPLSLPATKRHRHFGQRSQPHQHIIYLPGQVECRNKIQQLIHDFYHVFEANARQNEQRMHQLYARVFQQDVDPMLAEDMQRLCLTVSAAPPPCLSSLLQPGLSSAFGSFCVTSDSMRDSFLITDNDALDNMIFLVPTTTTSTTHPSLPRKKNRNWVKGIWGKNGTTTTISTKQRHQQHNKQKQQQPSSSESTSASSASTPNLHFMQQHDENTGLMQQQQQGWSICLGLVSEHLLHVGQQYYTQWIRELIQAQHQQTMPFQVATETLASMYRALQIEQGHAILTRLCTQLESCLS